MSVGNPSPLAATFDIKRCLVNAGGLPFSGFGPGAGVIKISYASDAWTDVCGADGEVVRSATNDKRANVTISLMPHVLSAVELALKQKLDSLTGSGAFPLVIVDMNSGRAWTAAQAWIQKLPDADLGSETSPMAWPIRCALLDFTQVYRPATPTGT
jgi:hypothetical protein